MGSAKSLGMLMGGMSRSVLDELDYGSNSTDLGYDSFEPALSSIAYEKAAKEEREAKMFKNVLTVPKDYGYFKYFDKISHPERLTPQELSTYEAFPATDLNESYAQLLFNFELLKKRLYPKLSEFDKKLLKLPDAMHNEMQKNRGDNQKAYMHLRNTFLNSFITPLDESKPAPIQWIDYQFAVNNEKIQRVLADLKNNFYNSAAIQNLTKKLYKIKAFDNKETNFYFWNTDPQYWSDI